MNAKKQEGIYMDAQDAQDKYKGLMVE